MHNLIELEQWPKELQWEKCLNLEQNYNQNMFER